MKEFSEKWQIIAAIILVVVAVLYGIFCSPAQPEPKHRAGTYENFRPVRLGIFRFTPPI